MPEFQCSIVQAWIERGHFDLVEMQEHVKTCKICQHIMRGTTTDLRQAFADAGMLDEEEATPRN